LYYCSICESQIQKFRDGKIVTARVYYDDVSVKERVYLLVLFAKNVKEDLSSEEKRWCRSYIEQLKKELKV